MGAVGTLILSLPYMQTHAYASEFAQVAASDSPLNSTHDATTSSADVGEDSRHETAPGTTGVWDSSSTGHKCVRKLSICGVLEVALTSAHIAARYDVDVQSLHRTGNSVNQAAMFGGSGATVFTYGDQPVPQYTIHSGGVST